MARLQPAEPNGLNLVRRLTSASAKRMYGRPMEPTTVLGIEGQGFTEGMYCVRPERALVGASAAR